MTFDPILAESIRLEVPLSKASNPPADLSEEDREICQKPTAVIDSDSSEVQRFAKARMAETDTPLEAAVKLYYAVRDEVRYDPYTAVVSAEGLRASVTLAAGKG